MPIMLIEESSPARVTLRDDNGDLVFTVVCPPHVNFRGKRWYVDKCSSLDANKPPGTVSFGMKNVGSKAEVEIRI